MKRLDRKSDCAINFSLETFGDPWSLLIVRDIVFFGKKTYGDFLASEERIGTSVLANRLMALEKQGILSKSTNQADKRKEEYRLTEKGTDLIPVLFELMSWGAKYDANTGASPKVIAQLQKNRKGVIARAYTAAHKGVAFAA